MTSERSYGGPPHYFGDLDGDGGLDAVLVLSQTTGAGREIGLVAMSLRDGVQLWSRSVRDPYGLDPAREVRIGDLDGDGRAEVVVLEKSSEESKNELAVRAFDGRDGKARWLWKSGVAPELHSNLQSIALANLDGSGTKSVCVSHVVSRGARGRRRIVVLDKDGEERARRDFVSSAADALKVGDSNGDGREEVLVLNGDLAEGRLCALDSELKEVWVWPARRQPVNPSEFPKAEEIVGRPRQGRRIERMLSAVGGRPGAVVITPCLAIDSSTARPRWTGQAALVHSVAPDRSGALFAPELLDPGDSGGTPLMIGNGLGATVCRAGMAADAAGGIAAAKGRLAVPVPDRLGGDPRWVRPLPWWSRLHGMFGPWAFLVAGGLAVVNVVLPVLFLRLVIGRRRVFRMWALLLVPVAAVVPLMVYLSVTPWLPVGEPRWLATEQRVFLVGTLAGVPVVLGVWWMVLAVVRGSWRRILAMVGLVVVATLLVAGGWIWVDRKGMAPIERYGWEGWELVLMVGAYGAAVIWGVGRVIVGAYRLVTLRVPAG